ncbi:biotin--[acetyl-CoA-carboxylase] ligase [Parvularcula marina]|uniref:biotin--[acetyl-CoA-carboxylase] ligase n=1 Tax=Parvularcula marina TaxID=2292771 RepID=UPI003515FFF4
MSTPVRHAIETASTSLDAKSAFEEDGETGPLWFTAARQSAGVGRRGRAWRHHPGNFAGSLLLPIEEEQLRTAPLFAFIAALCVAEAIDQAGVPASKTQVKWPNDVLLDGQKVAGILCELLTGPKGRAIVIGIGVNLLVAPEGENAATLAGYLETPPMPAEFREMLDERVQVWEKRAREEGFASVRQAWLERAAGLGAPIIVRQHDSTTDGLFEGIDEDGSLLLGTDGTTVRIRAADIFLGAKHG